MRRPVFLSEEGVAGLPSRARAFAELPYSPVTEKSRTYHLRVYNDWCTSEGINAWPPTLNDLMRFAADRASHVACFTVREHVRIVSLIERKRSGVDLFAHPTMQLFLAGVKRERPPAPVRPLRPAQIAAIFDYHPTTRSQRVTRAMMLLSYAAGFTLTEHLGFRSEMVRFAEGGIWVEGLSEARPLFFVGPSTNPMRSPARALELIVDARPGPIYRCARARGPDGGVSYLDLGQRIAYYGRLCGVTPLSNERIRLAGMIEQSRLIDVVRLAHFHGRRDIRHLAKDMNRFANSSSDKRWGRKP